MDNVRKVLQRAGLWDVYGSVFEDGEIDNDQFADFLKCEIDTAEYRMYKEMVPIPGHRLKILKASKVQQNNVSYKLTCYECHDIFLSVELFWKHLMSDHEISEIGTFVCPFCDVTFGIRKTFRKHIFAKKCTCTTEASMDFQPDEEFDDDPAIDAEQMDPENIEANDPECTDSSTSKVQKVALTFILALQKSGKIPLSISKQIQQLATELISVICDAVRESRENYHHAENDFERNRLDIQFEMMKNPFSDFDTQHKLEKFLKNHHGYTEPIQRRLGVGNGGGIMHLVPISTIITKLCKIPGFFQHVLKKDHSSQDEFYGSYKDGSHYKSSLSASNVPIIDVLLYYDDIEACNPLGSRACGNGKFAMFYLQIMNLPSFFKSKLESIFLLACTLTENVKKHGMNACLRPIVDDLINVWTNGIFVESDAYTGIVKVKLLQVVGDNLGIHSLLGYVESFSANYSCHHCRIHRNELRKSVVEDPSLFRTIDNYYSDLQKQDVSLTGIRHDCVLNDLPYFHVTSNHAPDILHDLLEGTCHRVLKRVLNHGISNKYFDLASLNYKIKSSSLGKLERKNKPSKITPVYLSGESHAGQSSSQMLCLFLHLPVWIGNCYPQNDKNWQNFIQLHQIIQIVFSDQISKAGLCSLRFLIEEFLSNVLELSKTCLKPKDHYLLHYCTLISKVGVLKQYWTMRFEGKHRFAKGVAVNASNHRNPSYTVFHRNQLQLVSTFLFLNFQKEYELEITNADEITLPTEIQSKFPDIEKCLECKDVLFNHVIVEAGSFFVHFWEENGPQIFQIIGILIIDEIPYCRVSQTKVIFNVHCNFYEIRGSTRHMFLLKLTEIDVVDDPKQNVSFPQTNNTIILTSVSPLPANHSHVFPSSSSSYAAINFDTNNDDVQLESVSNLNSEKAKPVKNVAAKNPTVAKKSGKRASSNADEIPSTELFNVPEILKSFDTKSVKKGEKLLDSLKTGRLMTPKERAFVTRRCAKAVVADFGSNPGRDIKMNMAKCIVHQIHPTYGAEAQKSLINGYYSPATRVKTETGKKSHSASGSLENRLNYLRKKNGRDVDSDEEEERVANVSRTPDLPELELVTKSGWLRNNKGPQEKVMSCMLDLFSFRRRQISEMSIDRVKTDWPRLFDSTLVIEQEFRLLYPEKGDRFYSVWPHMSKVIVKLGQEILKDTSSVPEVEWTILNQEGNDEVGALFVLPYLFRSKTGGKKHMKTVPAAESAKFFIQVFKDKKRLDEFVATNQTYKSPLIVLIGTLESLTFHEVYVLIEGNLLIAETVLQAANICFKSYAVLSIKYPAEAWCLFTFLDYSIFEIKQYYLSPPAENVWGYIQQYVNPNGNKKIETRKALPCNVNQTSNVGFGSKSIQSVQTSQQNSHQISHQISQHNSNQSSQHNSHQNSQQDSHHNSELNSNQESYQNLNQYSNQKSCHNFTESPINNFTQSPISNFTQSPINNFTQSPYQNSIKTIRNSTKNAIQNSIRNSHSFALVNNDHLC